MKSALLVCLAISIYSIAVQAQTLDKSFADNGILIENNSSSLSQFALQSNGKIVVAGFQGKTTDNLIGFLVARYNTDGSLDNSFGRNGYAGDNGKADQIFNVAVQANDDIIAVGRTTKDTKIKRFKKDGALDTAFGRNGTVILKAGIDAYSYPADVKVQPDGKILLSGSIITANQTNLGFIVRYLSNGIPDNTFGNNGSIVLVNPGSGFAGATSLALQQNGQILVSYSYNYGADHVVYRFKRNGTRDLSFGNNGTARFQSSDNVVTSASLGNDLLIQADGKITGSGYASDISGKLYLAAARLNADGSIDNSFGNSGLQHIEFIGKVSNTAGSVLQSDGKLIIAGSVKQQGNKAMPATTRLNTDGSIDSGFGENGRLVTQTDQYTECHDILLQPDNKILLGADAGISSSHIFIARYNNNVNGNKNIAKQLQQKQNGLTIKVSPNPAINNLLIEGLPSTQKIKITVVDFAGNIKLQAVANSNTYSLNIASLKAGNYLLKVETNTSVATKAFIKQ